MSLSKCKFYLIFSTKVHFKLSCFQFYIGHKIQYIQLFIGFLRIGSSLTTALPFYLYHSFICFILEKEQMFEFRLKLSNNLSDNLKTLFTYFWLTCFQEFNCRNDCEQRSLLVLSKRDQALMNQRTLLSLITQGIYEHIKLFNIVVLNCIYLHISWP